MDTVTEMGIGEVSRKGRNSTLVMLRYCIVVHATPAIGLSVSSGPQPRDPATQTTGSSTQEAANSILPFSPSTFTPATGLLPNLGCYVCSMVTAKSIALREGDHYSRYMMRLGTHMDPQYVHDSCL